MIKSIIEVSGHENGISWELVEEGCAVIQCERIRDHQQGAASVRKRSDRIYPRVSGRVVPMRVDAILFMQIVPVEYEVERFRMVAMLRLLVVPDFLCRLEPAHQNLIHFPRERIGVGAGLELLMLVASESHSGGTFLRGYLQGIVDAPSGRTFALRLDLNAVFALT